MITQVLIGAGGVAVGAVVAFIIQSAMKQSAMSVAAKLKAEAGREAEHIQREAKVTARAEILKMRDEAEAELKERRKEQSNQEKRLAQREESLDKRSAALEDQQKDLDKQQKDIASLRERLTHRESELAANISRQIDELERIAGMAREEAKEILLEKLKNEVRNESGLLVRNMLDEAKERSEKEANRILTYAIQRYASDCTYERTTATIPLPNDEMKGRIIGREGRNIRALEAATGVNILIDDTPEAVVISCFDPIRKEVARQLMERLISDGRIHPTRVEELTAKITREVEEDAYSAGERAVLETGLTGVAPQLIKLLGRLKYRYSFSQNVLQHSLETAYFMGVIAAELGLDESKARRIGLFHDIGKAVDHEVEGSHAIIGADIAKKYGEGKDIVHAIAAHHEDVRPESALAVLVQAADSLSGARPGARKELLENYVKRLEDLENITDSFEGVAKSYAIQAGRELRVIVNSDNVDDDSTYLLCKDISAKIEENLTYPGQIRVTVIRERRAVGFAK